MMCWLCTALAGALCLMYGPPAALKVRSVRILAARCRASRSLALTYDDGPGRTITSDLLSRFAAPRVRATFFPTLRSADCDPAGLAALQSAGHELGCHSARHLHAWRTSPWRSAADVRAGLDGMAALLPPRP
ncbi:MAG: polysaccharide deacetylase family protein, partial [Planctomycetota bacterium]